LVLNPVAPLAMQFVVAVCDVVAAVAAAAAAAAEVVVAAVTVAAAEVLGSGFAEVEVEVEAVAEAAAAAAAAAAAGPAGPVANVVVDAGHAAASVAVGAEVVVAGIAAVAAERIVAELGPVPESTAVVEALAPVLVAFDNEEAADPVAWAKLAPRTGGLGPRLFGPASFGRSSAYVSLPWVPQMPWPESSAMPQAHQSRVVPWMPPVQRWQPAPV
jgi:hypothetical protein